MNSHKNYHEDSSNCNSQEKQFHRSQSISNDTKRIVQMLDQIELRVEELRRAASGLEIEKQSLITMLTSVKQNKEFCNASDGEREEIELTAKRLLERTQCVEVSVTTPRDEIQQKALDNVNKYLEDLMEAKNSEKLSFKETLRILSNCLNACLSDCKGPVDQRFQAAVLECTAYDQKQIKKKLEIAISSLAT